MKFDLSNPFKALFLLWAAACIVILPLMSRDAGITEDEAQHVVYGKRVLGWYEGTDRTAVESPFDSAGVWKVATEGAGSKTAINIYGGLVDGGSAFIYQKFTKGHIGEFETKHIISSLFGAFMIIIIGLICLRVTNSWGIALLGLVIASFTPRLVGYSLSNPKDIPFATMFAFSLFQIICFLKELPRLRIRRLILVALSFSLAMGIRSGALPLIMYFIAVTLLYLLWQWLQSLINGPGASEITLNKAFKIFGAALLVSFIGYLGCALFWPWDMMDPLHNPIRSLQAFKNLGDFNCIEQFEGNWIGNGQRPWYFEPKWLYITLPLTVTFGAILVFVMLPRFLRKGTTNILIYGLLLVSVVSPLLAIIVFNYSMLNAERHVFFVVPPLIVLATLGWAELFMQVKNPSQKLFLGITFLLVLSEPALFVINNNPVQSMYFSPVIGGEKGAFKNYEMDYWGYSIKPAIDWIEKNDSIHAPGRKARVRMWYGEQLKLTYYIDSSKNLAYALCEENSKDWDYSIQLPCESKYNHDLLYHWPPPGTVHEVTADGVPLCAIIKNPRIIYTSNGNLTQGTITYNQPVDSFALMLSTGVAFYQKANYNQAVIAFKNCVRLNPKNVVAINDVVASYNGLKMFDEAIQWAKKGLAIDTGFALLKNNLAETYKAKKTFVPTEAYYHNLSYNYYVQQDYLKTIEAAKAALRLNPNSSIAWNNICSAYNQLKEYQKAMDACDRGLKIDAQNTMLKNNRAEAARLAGQK